MRATLTFGALTQRAFVLALFLLGLIAAISGWRYGLGQLNDIGPGAFPMGLGVTLMVLAAIAFFSSKREPADEPRNLKAMLLIPAAILAWALLVEMGGLLIANAALVALMFFSEDDLKLRSGALLAVALTIGGYAVLVMGFHLPFHIIGEWP